LAFATACFDARGDVISDWSKTAFDYLVQYSPSTVHILRGMAMVHVAQFDAANAVTGGYSPYAVSFAAPGTSAEAAAAQAAYSVLTNVNRSNLPTLNAALANSLTAISNGPAKDQGILLGRAVADVIIQWRAGDNPGLAVPALTSTSVGRWRPTPPSFTPGINTQARYLAPWTMRSAAQFRPGPPPALNSAAYTADYQEVQRLGSAASNVRTADQTAAAIFQAGGIDVHNSTLCNVATNHPLPLVQSARLFALGYMAIHDAQIQVFDSKYTYNFWRPVTAIQNGASDGNPDTTADGSWSALLETPPHPEYPAAHAEESGALIEVIKTIYGDSISITASASTAAQPRTFASPSDLLQETMDSRIWAGAHFRNSCVAGADAGMKIARNAFQSFLRPVPALATRAPANAGEFQFSFSTGPSLSYVVERSGDFVRWTPTQTNIYGLFQYTDPEAGGVDHLFYRVTVR
jgi:hypothetical protein